MKILYIDQTGQLGGGELSLLDWLRASHEDAEVVLFEDGPFRSSLEQIDIPVSVLSLGSLKQIRRESGLSSILLRIPTLFRLRRKLTRRTLGFDVLYANSQKAFLLAALAKRRRQVLVWHLRDILTAEHFSPVLRKVAILFGNRFATVVIANSAATAASFIDAGGKLEKVRVVYSGVSSDQFNNIAPETIAHLRDEVCPDGKFLVGIFGRLAQWKGQHVLLEALSTIPDTHALIVGDALFGESSYAQELKARASRPDLAGRIHFLGFRKDVPALMKCVDVVVHASTAAEPLGRVIIEGMLAQKPVIATRAGGAVEILEDGKTGLMVRPGSSSDLVHAITALRADPELANRFGQAGRARAEQTFSLQSMITEITDVLNRVTRCKFLPTPVTRILYIDQTGQLGGGELSLFDWLRVSHQDAEVILFEDGPFRSSLEQIDIPVSVLSLGSLKQIRRESGLSSILLTIPTLFRLRRKLTRRTLGFDVLYANSQKAFLLAALAKRRRQVLVWHLRDILTAEHFSPVLRKVAILFGNRFATVVIANSAATAASFIDAGGKPEKVRVVYDGVDNSCFDRTDGFGVEQLRDEVCPDGKFLVGIFGRLAQWKGQHVLLEALSTIPDTHALIVGDALFGESSYAQELKARASRPDLAGRIHFLGFRKDVPALMKCVDVVVHASTAAEPLGRVIIEGMLAQKPVIATRAGGAVEILEDGKTGLMVRPGSSSDLVHAITALRADPELANRFGQAGRARAEQTFSLQSMITEITDVLNRVTR